jgi:hypothetical protein
MSKSKVIKHDFTKKGKPLYHGVRSMLYFWRCLSRDGRESVENYAFQKIGEERLAKRGCRSATKSRRG